MSDEKTGVMAKDEPVQISTLSTEKLKAIAYDLIVRREEINNNLMAINQEIARRKE
jgi:hypothetical protein